MMAAARTRTPRRLALLAALLAAACGRSAKPEPGPLDRMYMPTGLAVHRSGGASRLLVASSNADLAFDSATGGSVISIDPATGTVIPDGGVNIESFAGDLAIAGIDPGGCGSTNPPLTAARAVVATRGSNSLDAVRIDPSTGALSCDERCGVALSGPVADPLAVAVACRAGARPRAFVGFLQATDQQAWVTEYDLEDGRLRSMSVGVGPPRALAYDAARDRLFVLGVATGVPTPLRWIELGGCTFGPGGGCTVGEATFSSLPAGLELRSMALAHPFAGQPQRAFLTGRLYDVASAAISGGRTTDLGGVLLVVDLVDNALGGLDLRLVGKLDIGRGAQDVRVLPARGGTPPRRDVAVALAVDDGELWIYDDDTLALQRFGRDELSGAPTLGHQPFGLAVDPDPIATIARVYVGSFRESFVTPIDVFFNDPELSTTTRSRITGGTP